MTLNQLRYFCTASRCHSITKAAEELYVTQPTVSVAIRDLEIEFGISLFYRKGNSLILTQEGEELYNKATYILQYCTELQADYSSMARVKPPLRIGIPPMLSTVFFPELLIAFHDQYPEIAVVLEEYGVGVQSGSSKEPYESYSMSMSFDCDPDKAEHLKSLIYAEIDKLMKEGPTQEEIDNLQPPSDGTQRNFEGLLENLRSYKIPPSEQYAIILKSNFGAIGNPVWKGFSNIRGSNGKIKLPGHYLLSVIN